MTGDGLTRWWSVRRTNSRRPATYRCPFCGGLLHAMSEHVLIAPEGDMERRRHAHTDCVLAARKNGTLPSYDEWQGEARPDRGRRSLRSRVLAIVRRDP